MKQLSVLLVVALSGTAMAQCTKIISGPVNVENGILNGTYIGEHIPTKHLVPYEYVREADVVWGRRVWRTIDLREKINHPIYLPFDYYDPNGGWVLNNSRWSLWSILKYHVMTGELTVFSPENPYDFTMRDGDQFKYPVVSGQGKNYCNDSVFRQKIFPYLGKLGPQPVVPYATIDGDDSTILVNGIPEFVYPPRDTLWTLSKDIVQYHLKEDWYFDKELSTMNVRILGIAPVIYQKDENGQIRDLQEVFWLYFPHCRYVLNNFYAYNEHNDAQWMSFDDLFWKRRFNSTIYKESNVYDRTVDSYRTGVDALMESEKITEEIRNFEHDVWNF